MKLGAKMTRALLAIRALSQTCPECLGLLDDRGTCAACGWAPETTPKKSAGATRGETSQ